MKKRLPIRPMKGDALLVVDVQNDFLPGGNLPVPTGNRVVPVLNRYIEIFETLGLPLYASRDWHPANHSSFRDQGGPWPPHCIARSAGAQFAAELVLPKHTVVLSKGTSPEKMAYSCFEDTNLMEMLRDHGIRRLFIGGLATDYCVLNTVKDALDDDFTVFLLEDAIQAVNVQPDHGSRAKEEMILRGAMSIRIEDLVT